MKRRFSFTLLLVVAFLDYLGIGLVFPIFASFLFDGQASPFAHGTTDTIRAMWMGILIAAGPFTQLFAAPVLGSLSDQKGRKAILMLGLGIGLIGYLFAICGVKFQSLLFLLFYRILIGISVATATVIQAALVDMSTKENKGRHFSLYNMALGAGFTFGPFLGGKLSDAQILPWFDFSTPFLFCACVVALNLLLIHWKFQETRKVLEAKPLEFFRGIKQAGKALRHPTLKIIFLSFFCFSFGWDYYVEFISVTLRMLFDFTPSQIGNYVGYMGFLYALFVGVVIPPVAKRLSPEKTLIVSMAGSGIALSLFALVKNPLFFWGFIPFYMILVSFFWPVASTYISDQASEESQGEILGIYHAVQAVALAISPLISGSLVGAIPLMPVYLGSFTMVLGGGLLGVHLMRTRDRAPHRLDEGT